LRLDLLFGRITGIQKPRTWEGTAASGRAGAPENWLPQNQPAILAENEAVETFYRENGYLTEKRIRMGKILHENL